MMRRACDRCSKMPALETAVNFDRETVTGKGRSVIINQQPDLCAKCTSTVQAAILRAIKPLTATGEEAGNGDAE